MIAPAVSMNRWLRRVAGILLIGALPILFVASRATHESKALQSQNRSPDSLDQFAWHRFAKLVDTQSGSLNASWDSWVTPCRAGLWRLCSDQAQDPCGTKANLRPTLASQQKLLPLDVRAATIPAQVLIDYLGSEQQRHGTIVVDSFAEAPELATVLFDPGVATGIGNGNLGCDGALAKLVSGMQGVVGTARRIQASAFATGATAVKLIWEVVRDDSDVYVYDPTIDQADADNQLPFTGNWHSSLHVSLKNQGSCKEKFPSYGSKQDVPLGCFDWQEIPTKSTGFDCSQLSDFSEAYCEAGGKKSLIAVLVGVHVMTLRDNNPNWTWMTFYWRKDTNGQPGWMAPWSHFWMMSTDMLRTDHASAPHSYAYSPYMEGQFQNGTHQNCLNCHTFAVYPMTAEKQTSGIKYGSQEGFPSDREVNDYFTASIQTGLFWTIADNQNTQLQQARANFVKAVIASLGTR